MNFSGDTELIEIMANENGLNHIIPNIDQKIYPVY